MANSKVVNRTVNIYIQSGEAQKAYDALIAKQNKLKDALEKTTDPKKVDGLKNKLKELEEPIDRAAKKLRGELTPSLKDTQAAVNKLNNEFRRMSPEETGYDHMVHQIHQGNKELELQKGKVGMLHHAMKGFWSEVKMMATGMVIGNVMMSAFTGLTNVVTGLFKGAGKLSDELADIQRVSGLTAGEVRKLNKELTQLETRTSTSDLRGMAVIAGKLGIAKEQILSFVQATDKLKVALGDELGDVDVITTELGKIINVFDKEGGVTGDKMLKIGNAIVDMANKGVASGPFIVDFTQRLAGLAGTANLTLDASIGLAAGLEETGQRSESASTAVINVLGLLGNHVKEFAKIAGQDVNTFAKTIKEKPVEALLQLSEGLVKNKTGLQDLAPAFKEAGIDGTRVQTVLGVMGANAEFFRKKITEAGGALQSTGEIEDAFSLKNETLQGQMDKLGKTITRWFTSSGLSDFFKRAVNDLSALITPSKSLTQQFDELDQKVKALDKDILPLAKKYDELTSKTSLNKLEQAELNTTIQSLAKAMPFAVSAVDKYGNALQINTQRVYDFINAEKARLKVVNADAIKENQKKLDEINKQINKAKPQFEDVTNFDIVFTTDVSVSGGTGGAAVSTKRRQLTQEEKNETIKKYKDLLDSRLGYETEIKRLNGDAIQEQVDAAKKQQQTTTKVVEDDKKANKEREREAKKTENLFKKASEELLKWRRQLAGTDEGEMQKEIAAATEKYLKLRDDLKGHQDEMKKLEETFQNEVFQIISKYNQKDIDAFVKRQEAQEQAMMNFVEATGKLKVPTTVTDLVNRENGAKAELELMKTHGLKKLRLQLNQLEKERDQQLANDKLTNSEREKIEIGYQKRKFEIIVEWIGEYVRFFEMGVNLLATIDRSKTAIENSELERDRALNDKKRKNLDDRLKAGAISQKAYDREIQKLEKQQEAREREAHVKQFKRQQRIRMGQAVVDGYKAVTTTLADFGPPIPPNFPGIIAMAFTVGSIAAQIAGIAKEKPPAYARGGVLYGRSHAEGGMGVYDQYGKKQAELEGGEAIVNRRTIADLNRYTLSGTPSQIISDLNAMHGGVRWAAPVWKTTKPTPMNFSAIRKAQHYAQGGIFNAGAGSDTAAMQKTLADLAIVVNMLAATNAELTNKLGEPIKAYSVLTEQEVQQQRLDNIRREATFKP